MVSASDPIPVYLGRVSRRLALVTAMSRAATATVVIMGAFTAALPVAALLTWLGRPVDFVGLVPWAVLAVAVAVAGALGVAMLRRPHSFAAARHVDSRFGLKELLESAARLPACPASSFDQMIRGRAAAAVLQISPSQAVPLGWTPRLSTAAASLAAFVTLTLSLPQPKPAAWVTAQVSTSEAPPARTAWAPQLRVVIPASPAPPASDSGQHTTVAALPPLTQPGNGRQSSPSGGTAPADASPGQGRAESALVPTQMADPQAPTPAWDGLSAHQQPWSTPAATPAGSASVSSRGGHDSIAQSALLPGLSVHEGTQVLAPASPSEALARVAPSNPSAAAPAAGPSDPLHQHPDIPEHARELVRQYFARD